MCGIWIYLSKNTIDKTSDDMNKYFNKINNRGPDNSIIKKINNNIIIGFHRLSIMDPSDKGDQPFIIEQKNITTYLSVHQISCGTCPGK